MTTNREDMVAELLLPDLSQMLAQGRTEEVREAFGELLDPEVADVLAGLDPPLRAVGFGLLEGERASEVFDELEQDAREALIEELDDARVAEIFNRMDTDDRVDFLEDAPEEVAQNTLALMEPEERAETQQQLAYPEETVGRLMTPDFLTLRPEWRVDAALQHIREAGHEAESLHTLYVVDDHGRLIDHIRLRQLVLGRVDQTCEELREGLVVSLNALEDRESAVRVMERYDLPVLPVVDREGVMVGIVTFDDVADVAEEEATEDMHKLGGMNPVEKTYLSTTMMDLVRQRGVWLMLLFFGGLLTVTAMGFFHEQLKDKAILALFVPLIIASGGNSGSQAATLIIRALAIGELKVADWLRILRREISSGLILGSMLGVTGLVVGGIVAYFLPGGDVHSFGAALHMGFAIGTALVGVVLTGIVTGAMLPLMLESIGLDPATCSTPFVATIVDVAGLVIYFVVAMIVLGV